MTFHADVKLDCQGLSCPIPVLKTKTTIQKMEIGQVLEITATDPGSLSDIPAFCNRTGQKLLESIQNNGLYVFYIRKSK